MLPTQDQPKPVPDKSEDQIPAQIGRYRILGRLGVGGMGMVYKALDSKLNRVVALKLPRFDGPPNGLALRMQRFQREARAAASIRHPHVCPIYDEGEHEGQPYVVMAYIEGETLASHLSRKGRYQESRHAVELIRQVLDALEAVHSLGIIHRDLKPSNILLDADGRAVLTDFGLARPSDNSEGLTSEGVVVGTPAYMAPEQAAGQIDRTGPWTDLYSLGVILYQMLTGRLPFEGTALKVMAQILHESPPRPSSLRRDLDPTLEAIILKAMAQEPRDRFQSASEFKEVLARWPSSPSLSILPQSDQTTDTQRLPLPPIRPEPETPEPSLATKPRAARVKALFAVAILAAVAGGIALYSSVFDAGSSRQVFPAKVSNVSLQSCEENVSMPDLPILAQGNPARGKLARYAHPEGSIVVFVCLIAKEDFKYPEMKWMKEMEERLKINVTINDDYTAGLGINRRWHCSYTVSQPGQPDDIVEQVMMRYQTPWLVCVRSRDLESREFFDGNATTSLLDTVHANLK